MSQDKIEIVIEKYPNGSDIELDNLSLEATEILVDILKAFSKIVEFAKAATALALAKYLSDVQVNLREMNRQIQALFIVFLPVMLILPQPDPGSALIYFVFFFVLYREGLPGWYLVTGFIAILLFILTLATNNPYIVIGLTALTLVVNHYRSRLVDRNIFASILMFLMKVYNSI